jgi:GNAT superfamily N-acetyltransferase
MRLWEADLTVTPAFVAGHPVYCATRDGAIVGFHAVSGERSTRELEHMWVDPRHIGTGVGRLLFSHLLGHLRRSGARRLMIASGGPTPAWGPRAQCETSRWKRSDT